VILAAETSVTVFWLLEEALQKVVEGVEVEREISKVLVERRKQQIDQQIW
jgi:hypothetical protein